MSDVRESLWSAFFSEVGEQLLELELLLLQNDQAVAVDVNAVFRYFHTIKSSSAMMAYTSMEALAHVSEDLLDKVRRGETGLDSDKVDVLLRVVDCLKNQLAAAAETRDNPPEDAELLSELRETLNHQEVPPAPATTAPEQDVSVILEPFAVTCRDLLPRILLPAADGVDTSDRAPAIYEVIDAANEMGFHAVVRLLQKLDLLKESDGDAARAEGMRIRAEVINRLRYVEQVSKIDCGIKALESALLAANRQSLRVNLEKLIDAVNGLRQVTNAGMPAQLVVGAKAMLTDAELVLQYTRLMGLQKSADLMTLVRQSLRDLARGHLKPSEALLDMLGIAAMLLLEICSEEGESQHYIAMSEETLDEFRSVLLDGVGGSDISAKFKQIRALVEMQQEYLDLLTPRAVTKLLEAFNRRGQVVEIEADLESYPAISEQFVKWIHDNGEVISNRTVFHRTYAGQKDSESSRLRFLVELRSSLEDLKLALGRMDPERRLFELHQLIYRDSTPQRTLAPTASPEGGKLPDPVAQGHADTVRIDSATLDSFVTRVGEMVTLRNIVTHSLSDELVQSGVKRGRRLIDKAAGTGAVDQQLLKELASIFVGLEERYDSFLQTDTRMQNSLKRLQQDVLDLRVVPVALVFNRMPRIVRSISQTLGKEVHVSFDGEQSRIDKSMIEMLSEPLMHIVRNSVDHGIEPPEERIRAGKAAMANLLLSARQQGNMMVIEVKDDGRGLDFEKIRNQAVRRGLASSERAAELTEAELKKFIFMPGFSTAESITETSGRGVGMDVVRTQIVAMGGQIEVISVAGAGVTFQLKLPLTVAIQGIILVVAGEHSVAIPERNVAEIAMLPKAKLQSVRGQTACLLRGAMLPVFRLSHLLGAQQAVVESPVLDIVVLSNGTYRIGLIVDEIVGRQEAFVRDLHPALSEVPGVGGTSILGNGRIAVIADVDELLDLARKRSDRLCELTRAL